MLSAVAGASATSDSVINQTRPTGVCVTNGARERAVNSERPVGITKEIRQDGESELAGGTIGVVAVLCD